MYGAGTGILGTLLNFNGRFLKFHMMKALYYMYGAGTGILGTLLNFNGRFLKFHMMKALYQINTSTLFLGGLARSPGVSEHAHLE
jgi:uncharacterized membrane protein